MTTTKTILWRSLVTLVLTIVTLALIAGCSSPTAPTPKVWRVAPPTALPYSPTPIPSDSFTTIRFHKP